MKHVKKINLSDIILEESIRVSLSEQPKSTIKSKPLSAQEKSATVTPWNAAKIAQLIYDSKGYVLDDEEFAKKVIERNIHDLQQYQKVRAELQKLTGGAGIAAYLRSFMPLNDRLDVADHLMTGVIPQSQWDTIITQLVPWEDLRYVQTDPYKTSAADKRFGDYAGTGRMTQTALDIAYKLYPEQWKTRDEENWKEFRHEMLFTSSVVTSIIPIIGPFLSGGLGLLDAKYLWEEGQYYEAGLIATLTLLPGIGRLAAKAGVAIKPFIKNIVTKLANKQAVHTLTKVEREALIQVAMRKDAIKSKLMDMTAKGIESGKLNPYSLKGVDWITKGTKKGTWFVGSQVVVPTIAYDYAFTSDYVQNKFKQRQAELASQQIDQYIQQARKNLARGK
jgi:hypothetical protein